MPKGKRGKQAKLDTSRGQQNPIGIVNKQRSTGAPGSGTRGHQKNPGSGTKRQGVSTGVGVTEAAEAAPKPTKTKTTKAKAVEKGPSKKVEEGPSKKVKKGVPKVKPAEAEGKYTITKRSAAHTRTGHAENTQTHKVASRGRYRGKGVVGRR